MTEPEDHLKRIVRDSSQLMRRLELVREEDLNDWYIIGGAVRNTVWAWMYNRKTTPVRDIDIVHFDSSDLSIRADVAVYERLCLKEDVDWNVFNQARAHIRDPLRAPATSTIDGVSYFFETPSIVGVQLTANDDLEVCAPYGVEDLLNGVVRPATRHPKYREFFKQRVRTKGWENKWPQIQVMPV